MNHEESKVKDIYIAALLKVMGFKLAGMEQQDQVTYFIYEDKEKVQDFLNREYFTDSVKVNAKELFDTVREMKQRIKTFTF